MPHKASDATDTIANIKSFEEVIKESEDRLEATSKEMKMQIKTRN